MFNKKIVFSENFITIDDIHIDVESISGIRIIDSDIFSFISGKIQTVEIFLKNGNVLYLDKNSVFFVKKNNNEKKISIKESINILKKYYINKNQLLNNWFEWRLIIPIVIAGIVSLIICMINKVKFEDLVLYGIYSEIFGFIIGFIWERKARKNRINRMME